MLFFPSNGEAYIHYDLPYLLGSSKNKTEKMSRQRHGRTFAKLIGNGLTTTNLTDPAEQSCLRTLTPAEEPDVRKRGGRWHQATNALRLILCNRSEPSCREKKNGANSVFIGLVHRKFENQLELPMRYERLFMAWQSVPPFRVVGVSKHPLLFANETAQGWTESQGWDDDSENRKVVERVKGKGRGNATEPYGGKGYWAYFTYTVSMSYAWGRPARPGRKGGDESEDMHVGYLDDEVVLAVGVDDEGGVFGRVKARELVQCMEPCP